MTSAERRQRERTEMQALIRETAMRLFTSEGVENVSMRRLAEAIEYTPGALYSYYKDKAELLYALHVEGFAKLHALQLTIDPKSPPLARLRRCGETYLQFAFENPQLYELMFISRSIMPIIEEQCAWDQGLRTYDFLRTIVRDCMAAGHLPNGELEGATYAMWSLVHGAASLVLRGRCPVIPEGQGHALVRQAYEFFMRFLESKTTVGPS